MLPIAQFYLSFFLGVGIGLISTYVSYGNINLHIEYLDVVLMEFVIFFLIWRYIWKKRVELLEDFSVNVQEKSLSIAHELVTNLSSINIRLEKIKILTDDEKIIDLVCKSKNSVTSCNNFLNTYQMNSKQYFSKKNIKEEYITNLTKMAIEEYAFFGDNKKLLKLNFIDDFRITIDKRIFTHIIFNLLNNAFFFIDKCNKGEIYISTYEEEKNNFLIIKDTAYGIKEEHISSVFNKGFSKRKYGSGLGLYFCKSALKEYGGDIYVESKFGEYTIFFIKFEK
jgi:signal transduction histidine kinase